MNDHKIKRAVERELAREQSRAYQDNTPGTIPARGFTGGHINWEGQALAAIEGMPPGDISEELARLQFDYEQWLLSFNESWWARRRRRRAFRELQPGLDLLFRQLGTAVRVVTKFMADEKAAAINEDLNGQALRLFGDHKKLRAFLAQRFNADLELAEASKVPLVDVVINLLQKGPS